MSRHDFPRLFHALKPLSNRGISPISRRNGRRGFLGIKNPRFVVISSAGARLGWAMPPAQPMGAAAASVPDVLEKQQFVPSARFRFVMSSTCHGGISKIGAVITGGASVLERPHI
jgi:hypothetical protein